MRPCKGLSDKLKFERRKNLNTISNHCTNIAEWVEFSVTGAHKDYQ